MPNLIDKPQLQATAQVAKSYILDQDTANVNTIINALQQSGGGGTGKTEGVITCDYPTVTYNGDGTLYKVQSGSVATIQSGATYARGSASEDIFFFATATDNYTAAVAITSKAHITPA